MKHKNRILFISKLLIPLVAVLLLIIGGISTGIITFKPREKESYEEYITAEIKLDFGDGNSYSNVITLQNATVFDFLLKIEENGIIIIETTYWEQFDSIIVDSIKYNAIKYESDTNHYWAYYINGSPGMESADKTIVNNNDIIEWKYEEF